MSRAMRIADNSLRLSLLFATERGEGTPTDVVTSRSIASLSPYNHDLQAVRSMYAAHKRPHIGGRTRSRDEHQISVHPRSPQALRIKQISRSRHDALRRQNHDMQWH